MNNTRVVYSYCGLGDHLIAYGIIKEFSKQYDKIIYRSDLMNKMTFNNIVRIYSSIPNVEIIEEPIVEGVTPLDHCVAHTRIWFDSLNPWLKDPSVPYACNTPAPEWFNEDWQFDKQWYMNAPVPFNLKWDNFYFERDLNKEKEVYYDKLGLKDNEEFIFMQDDLKRGHSINRQYIDNNYKLIDFFNLQEISMLDILYTVEQAKEVHVINSACLTFFDLMNLQHNNLNYHKYNRSCFWDQVSLRLNWKIIE
jgi:hypothetical protein